MSELKRFNVVGKYSDEETMLEYRPDGIYYDADEVDKVLAEKDAEIARLKQENEMTFVGLNLRSPTTDGRFI